MSVKSGPPKTKKGLSYVLGDNNDHENHILPINAIQYSQGNVFTAGRDGTIKVWNNPTTTTDNPNISSLNHFVPPDNDTSSYQDIDERILMLETSISSNPVPYYKHPSSNGSYSITASYNIHFDWINDIKLINNNTSLVSCSSDLSIKLMDVSTDSHDASSIHKFPNYHTDYIKKLTYNSNHNQIVSGGLDGKIIIWDLQALKPSRQLINSSHASGHNWTTSGTLGVGTSIYSLSNNSANLISTGGCNNTVNLFDKRAPKAFVRKLIGHQDNVRCLLMNDTFILSGSSDSSIKLWDLRTFKVYKTFDVHEYPVWSLTSESDNFSVFYSGDKGGNIVKTDMSYLHQLHHNPSPEFDTFTSLDHSVLDEKLGVSMLVAQENSPILALSHADDQILSSNYTSLAFHRIPDLENISRYQYLRSSLDHSINRGDLNDEFTGLLLDGTNSNNDDMNSDFYDIVSHLSVETNTHDLHSTFSHHQYEDSNESDYEDDQVYSSMFLDVNGGASREFVNMSTKLDLKEEEEDILVDKTPVEILLNAISQSQIRLIPYNLRPSMSFRIVPKSIIAKRFLNNKRQIMVMYLNGDITIWDVLICKEIKFFPYTGNTLIGEAREKRLKEMDAIYNQHQTDEILNNWSEAEVKAGKLLVTIKESSFMNVEIYYDELVRNYPFTSLDHLDNAGVKQVPRLRSNKDDRFYIGSILLNSLLNQYTQYEWDFDARLREEMLVLRKAGKNLNGTDDTTVSIDTSSLSSNMRRLKNFGRKSSKSNVSVSSNLESHNASPDVSANTSIVDYSLESSPMYDFIRFSQDSVSTDTDTKTTSSFDYENSIMNLLQTNKKVYWEKYCQPTFNAHKGKVVGSLMQADHIDLTLLDLENAPDEDRQYHPIIRSSHFPPDLLITIFEYSPDLGNYRDLCSFRFEDILNLKKEPNDALIRNLRLQLPRWIGTLILYNKWPQKESPKIAFQLLECDYSALDPSQKIGGRSQRKIKKLPVLESSIKLTSHNMLRVSKILAYLTEKFDSRTSEMRDKKLTPVDWLALDCKGQELSNDMTLQTIKTNIWKNSSDIELRFRRKFDQEN